MTSPRQRLAITLGSICAALALGAFYYFGENRAVDDRARTIAAEKAIWATAAQRGTTYAAIRSGTGNCYLNPVIDPRECEHRILYGDNYDVLWERQRMIEWLELPFDIALAFALGFLSIYLFAAGRYLIRDLWWPWVQGR